jgi:threonine synthase
VKNDTVNPTGSFKDRVVSVALTRARELGFKVAACASTGNLANSVAAHAARAGMRSVVCIPADLEIPKVVTTAVFGGVLVAVNGNYDEVNRLCAELASEYPTWAFVNVNVRSYYAEGSKTLAFEVAEQLGWTAPDHVIVPIASGSQLTKVAKGFRELFKVGRRGADGPYFGSTSGRVRPCRYRLRVRCRLHPPGKAQRHRQIAGYRQPRRRCLCP